MNATDRLKQIADSLEFLANINVENKNEMLLKHADEIEKIAGVVNLSNLVRQCAPKIKKDGFEISFVKCGELGYLLYDRSEHDLTETGSSRIIFPITEIERLEAITKVLNSVGASA